MIFIKNEPQRNVFGVSNRLPIQLMQACLSGRGGLARLENSINWIGHPQEILFKSFILDIVLGRYRVAKTAMMLNKATKKSSEVRFVIEY